MTILKWFSAEEAENVGTALADQFATAVPAQITGSEASPKKTPDEALRDVLSTAERDVRSLRLNIYQKAKFANSFKWRLREKGFEDDLADELTQSLVMKLSDTGGTNGSESAAATPVRPDATSAKHLLAQGNKCLAQGNHAEAVVYYQDLVNFNPRHAVGFNNLGSALCKLGRYKEAEDQFRQAIKIEPNYPDAHANLGTLLRWRGQIAAAEGSLRRALKLKPNFVDARTSLGLTQLLQGRLRDARARFDKTLKASRGNTEALLGMGQIAKMEGRFDEAEKFFKRALDSDPKMPTAWAALVSLRKMTPSDQAWLQSAEKIAATGIDPLEAADMHFAIGKYHDDVGDFDHAFESYKRANELQKIVAEDYDRAGRSRFVNDLIRVYSRDAILRAKAGASPSDKPIFVIGMMRSGTSLTEQIIASHPSVSGAGEFAFWSDAVDEHASVVREGPPGDPLRSKLATAYLHTLESHSADALRVVDKTPVNSDYLGVIHTVFPNARIIYMQRDPVDTCLSCYFQQFSPALNFSMDMADLAHYYREHHRLMAHWRAVLPPGTILDVPYADLVADHAGLTRRILHFLGLEWDDRVVDFHKTKRPVVTASSWQVRQKIYGDSLQRWRNYEKHIKPLLALRDLSR
jgi:tetratricopeptide (TPR) repeat protein